MRRIAISFLFGIAATIISAWCCILWTPLLHIDNPVTYSATAAETLDLDGEIGLQYIESGFGWSSTSLCGSKGSTNGHIDVIYPGPYGQVQHRCAGFPFSALWSRVAPVDSPRRTYEGDPDPPAPSPVRHKWKLPLTEILHRGPATSDLPKFLHAQPGRRLPLIPLLPGFLANTAFYAAAYLAIARALHSIRHRLTPHRGFEVLPPFDGPSPTSN